MLALGLGATATPAFARVDNVECNWLGLNCRGFWDHGYSDTTVWSKYKQLDLNHGSSVFGTTPQGVGLKDDSYCKPANTWANSYLSNVTKSRAAYYRNC